MPNNDELKKTWIESFKEAIKEAEETGDFTSLDEAVTEYAINFTELIHPDDYGEGYEAPDPTDD